MQFHFLSQSHQRSGWGYFELFCVSSQTNMKTLPQLHYKSISNNSSGACSAWTYLKTNTNLSVDWTSVAGFQGIMLRFFGKCWCFLEEVGEAALLPLAAFQPRTIPFLCFDFCQWNKALNLRVKEQSHADTYTHIHNHIRRGVLFC